jgi:release factor glutamine methyltransferase
MPDLASVREAKPLTAADAIRGLSARFREAGLDAPELDARLLVLQAAGLSHEAYVLDPQWSLPAGAAGRVEDFAARRLAREPVSRIIGSREFWGRSFAVDASTLDPRPDTETLVEAVLAAVDEDGGRERPLRLLDLGTGTGCILLTLLAELPRAWGVGIDISQEALAVARRNAQAHGLSGRAAFCCGDWAATISGTFHYILSNPPYIRSEDIAALDPEVRDYDPRRALDGGADGFAAYRRIAQEALALAAPGARLALEAGAGQMRQLHDLLVNTGWQSDCSSCRVYPDLSGQDRVVVVGKQQ